MPLSSMSALLATMFSKSRAIRHARRGISAITANNSTKNNALHLLYKRISPTVTLVARYVARIYAVRLFARKVLHLWARMDHASRLRSPNARRRSRGTATNSVRPMRRMYNAERVPSAGRVRRRYGVPEFQRDTQREGFP